MLGNADHQAPVYVNFAHVAILVMLVRNLWFS